MLPVLPLSSCSHHAVCDLPQREMVLYRPKRVSACRTMTVAARRKSKAIIAPMRLPPPIIMHVHVDKFEVTSTKVRQVNESRTPSLNQLWPDLPPAPDNETLGGTCKRWAKRLWPILSLIGTILAFFINRVGVGLRFEDFRRSAAKG